jgi:hypothetical protein
VFAKFDDLLLLSEGKQMYSGELNNARQYMENKGFPAPPEMATAEHILDESSLLLERSGHYKRRGPFVTNLAYIAYLMFIVKVWTHLPLRLCYALKLSQVLYLYKSTDGRTSDKLFRINNVVADPGRTARRHTIRGHLSVRSNHPKPQVPIGKTTK